jgi:hypothetical protein
LMLSAMTFQAVAADVPAAQQMPRLHMKIVNPWRNQQFALCLSETCYVLSDKQKEIALADNTVNSVVMTNMSNMQMYAQVLPESCKVSLKNNETLTVSGKLVAKDQSVFLNDMKCSVTTTA